MSVCVYTSKLVKSQINVPTSKSSMQRALALSLIHRGHTKITRPGNSNDDKAALSIVQTLGASVQESPDGSLHIESEGVRPHRSNIYCGESGLSVRMFTPIAATHSQSITINGGGSLGVRPLNFFEEVFPKLGVIIQSNEGKLPLHIQGPLRPTDIEVSGALSSQYITGLLLAYVAQKAKGVTLRVDSVASKPYIHLTLQMMKHFGYDVVFDEVSSCFHFHENTYHALASTVSYQVEGDWSGASFLLVASAIGGDMTFSGLEKESVQADKSILGVFNLLQIDYEWEGSLLHVFQSTIHPFDFDATDCPDLFPPLVSLASYAIGTTRIKGVNRLKHKESDRGSTLRSEFQKLGTSIILDDDVMIIEGRGTVKGGVNVSSHNDHRIAMACAVVALFAQDSAVTIEGAEAINKSYPQFYEDLKRMGAKVT